MDEQRRRIQEDLAGLLEGELRCDSLTLSMYSSDGSLYQIEPLAVAYPRCTDDLVVLVKYADSTNTSITARGAGSGVAGGAIGNGIVIDFSRYLNRIERVDGETVRVQPGVVRSRLNHVLKEYGRYFPPDPSNSDITTVGGMLAVDAAGSHSVRVGSTRDHVQSVETVLGTGEVLELGVEPLHMLQTQLETGTIGKPEIATHFGDARRTLVSKLSKLIDDNRELIREHQPALIRNCSGYHLRSIRSETHLNLARLLVGSEGTLGLFSAATLHTAPLPANRGVALILFSELESSVKAVHALSGLQPSACDLMDRRLLSLAGEEDERFSQLIPAAAEAALLVEMTGFSPQQVKARIRMVIDAVRQVDSAAHVARQGYGDEEVEFLWSLPGRVVPNLTRLRGTQRPLPFVEDISVPPESLREFVLQAQKVFQKHQVTASFYAHAAAGQLHFRPFLPRPLELDGRVIESIANDLYEEVFRIGGSISGEHGDGLVRSPYVQKQYGPLYRVFQQVKEVFDPHNILNPGKILGSTDGSVQTNLRVPAEPQNLVELQLEWSPDRVADEANQCNGCGVCRTQEDHLRMCPFFRIDPIEEASPRAKANVLRSIASEGLDFDELRSPEMNRLANLCFNCKQCQLECPSSVDIPQMMIEAKGSYVASNGIDRPNWLLARAHSLSTAASRFSLLANSLISNRSGRWLLERVFGIARQRKLPRLARRPFLKSLPRGLKEPPASAARTRPVVYFVDYFANHHDPELARAFLAILSHNGIPIHVPAQQRASGMAMVCAGELDAARELANDNLRVLGDFARDGCHIVCTEPTAAVCLTQEYPAISDHPDVHVVAEQTIEAGAYLRQLHEDGRLRTDFKPLSIDVGYHTPCHLKALNKGTPLLELLSLIPDLTLNRIERGCSGMAGAYGLTRENFRTSVRIGWELISEMRDSEYTAGVTECSSCKLQMEQGTQTPTIHPLKIMALAYGLMPEIEDRLKPNRKKLVTS